MSNEQTQENSNWKWGNKTRQGQKSKSKKTEKAETNFEDLAKFLEEKGTTIMTEEKKPLELAENAESMQDGRSEELVKSDESERMKKKPLELAENAESMQDGRSEELLKSDESERMKEQAKTIFLEFLKAHDYPFDIKPTPELMMQFSEWARNYGQNKRLGQGEQIVLATQTDIVKKPRDNSKIEEAQYVLFNEVAEPEKAPVQKENKEKPWTDVYDENMSSRAADKKLAYKVDSKVENTSIDVEYDGNKISKPSKEVTNMSNGSLESFIAAVGREKDIGNNVVCFGKKSDGTELSDTFKAKLMIASIANDMKMEENAPKFSDLKDLPKDLQDAYAKAVNDKAKREELKARVEPKAATPVKEIKADHKVPNAPVDRSKVDFASMRHIKADKSNG